MDILEACVRYLIFQGSIQNRLEDTRQLCIKNIMISALIYIYINRFCRKLGKNYDFIKKAFTCVCALHTKNKANPITSAASAIYLAHQMEDKDEKNSFKNPKFDWCLPLYNITHCKKVKNILIVKK